MSEHHSNGIPERVFMNALLKHTGIALAIIIPLAAYSAFAQADTLDPVANDSITIVVPK